MRKTGTLADLARIYRVSRAAIAKWKADPDFPPVEKVGRGTRVDLEAVARWHANREAAHEIERRAAELDTKNPSAARSAVAAPS